MASPVELSDLPLTTSPVNGDLMLVRKGLTDYQTTVGAIRNINVNALNPLPTGSPETTDAFLINRNIAGTPTNFQVPFYLVGFPKGTRMWFWMGDPPLGWSIINGTGDRLLAVASFDAGYAGGGGGAVTGTWQQDGVPLGLTQIPNHQHWMRGGSNSDNSNNIYMEGARTPSGVTPAYSKGACVGVVDGKGDGNNNHDQYGQCDPHNHGATWRPLANVGVLANKDN